MDEGKMLQESIDFHKTMLQGLEQAETKASISIDYLLELMQICREYTAILTDDKKNILGYHIVEERIILNQLTEQLWQHILEGTDINEDMIKICNVLKMGLREVVAHQIEPVIFNIGNMKRKPESENGTNDICTLANNLDPNTMNDLERFLFMKPHKKMTKWLHYFEVYDRHFSKYRNQPITILEIGIFNGGSLQMWKDYFGDQCRIIGIDIDPRCKALEEEQIEVHIGSQEDREFLRRIKQIIPRVDILIDDGGHTMKQQIVTFEELYDWVAEEGVYLCEDLHTSYWSRFGGGYKNPDSYIEYTKDLIDQLNAWHSQTDQLYTNEFSRSTHSMHYYDSMLVIEKTKKMEPMDLYV